MSRVAVVVPLRPGAFERAEALLEAGPPFQLEDTPLTGHCVHLTEHEAVFVFEGPDARGIVEHIVGEAEVWHAASAWARAPRRQAPHRRDRVLVASRGARTPAHPGPLAQVTVCYLALFVLV